MGGVVTINPRHVLVLPSGMVGGRQAREALEDYLMEHLATLPLPILRPEENSGRKQRTPWGGRATPAGGLNWIVSVDE